MDTALRQIQSAKSSRNLQNAACRSAAMQNKAIFNKFTLFSGDYLTDKSQSMIQTILFIAADSQSWPVFLNR